MQPYVSSNNSRCPDFTIAADRKDEEAPKWPIEDGKLFNDIRSWTCDDGLLGYNELFDFMYYIDRFASRVVGHRALAAFYRKNRSKTIFDKITPQQVAYSVLLSENMMEMWEEECIVRETCRTKDEIEAYNRTATQKYHVKKGTRINKYHDGWTNEGRAYLKMLVQEFGRIFGNVDFKTNLVEHWRTYVAKNHRTSYKRARAVEAVGEVEEYDEEDTLLDLPDDNLEQMALPYDGDACSEA